MKCSNNSESESEDYLPPEIEYDLYEAIYSENNERIKELIETKKVHVGWDSNAILTESIIHYNIDMICYLLKDPAVDPTVHQNMPIYLAAMGGNIEVVRILLQDPRVDPSDNDNIAIKNVAQRGFLDVVTLLVEHSKFRAPKDIFDDMIARYTGVTQKYLQEAKEILIIHSQKLNKTISF